MPFSNSIPWVMASVSLALSLPASAAADGGKWFDPPNARVFIEQHGNFVRIEEPDFHMAAARRSFEHGNLYAASDEVERAAGGVAFMAEHAAGQRRRNLLNAQSELLALKNLLRRKEAKSVAVLDRVFRITENAMSQTKE